MRVDEVFEVAAGTVAGRTHVLAGRPNQDAFSFRRAPFGLIGVVCDGCGSGAHSGIGATIGAHIVVEQAMAEMEAGADIDEAAMWERVGARTIAALSAVARSMGAREARTAAEFFLFTVLGVAVSRRRAAVFGAGDGMFAVGEERVVLGPYPGNAPPYLGYGLTSDGPPLSVHRSLAVEAFDSALVGTDGAADAGSLEGTPRPGGRGELVGNLREFWTNDRYFRNEDAISRTLRLLNREVQRPLWAARRLEREPGLLDDDTTILVVRRRK